MAEPFLGEMKTPLTVKSTTCSKFQPQIKCTLNLHFPLFTYKMTPMNSSKKDPVLYSDVKLTDFALHQFLYETFPQVYNNENVNLILKCSDWNWSTDKQKQLHVIEVGILDDKYNIDLKKNVSSQIKSLPGFDCNTKLKNGCDLLRFPNNSFEASSFTFLSLLNSYNWYLEVAQENEDSCQIQFSGNYSLSEIVEPFNTNTFHEKYGRRMADPKILKGIQSKLNSEFFNKMILSFIQTPNSIYKESNLDLSVLFNPEVSWLYFFNLIGYLKKDYDSNSDNEIKFNITEKTNKFNGIKK